MQSDGYILVLSNGAILSCHITENNCSYLSHHVTYTQCHIYLVRNHLFLHGACIIYINQSVITNLKIAADSHAALIILVLLVGKSIFTAQSEVFAGFYYSIGQFTGFYYNVG